MLRRKLKLMLLMCSSVLVSCASTPPDFTGCADLIETGHCVTYMSKKKFDVDEKHLYTTRSGKKLTWEQTKAGAVLLPADQFVWLKTYFDNYCHQNTCPGGIGDWNQFANDLGQGLKSR